jgi:hypothetical protein
MQGVQDGGESAITQEERVATPDLMADSDALSSMPIDRVLESARDLQGRLFFVERN